LRQALLVQLNKRRQKSGQGLAAAGRRDQQHRAPVTRPCQQLKLMRARPPAALREPARERLRQRGASFDEVKQSQSERPS
jgi:hypothetical protein